MAAGKKRKNKQTSPKGSERAAGNPGEEKAPRFGPKRAPKEPVPEFAVSRHQEVLEVGGWILWAVSLILVIVCQFLLPDTITTKYTALGVPAGEGSTKSLFLSPVIMGFAMTVLAMTLHRIDPKDWHLPFDVKPSVREKVISSVRTMVFALIGELGLFSLFHSTMFALQKGQIMAIGIFVWAGIFVLTLAVLFGRTVLINSRGK